MSDTLNANAGTSPDAEKTKKYTMQRIRQIFISLVCGIEFLCIHYTSFKVNGLSNTVVRDMDDYEPELEQFYENNKEWLNEKLSPQTKLFFQLLGQAISLHLTKKIFGEKN